MVYKAVKTCRVTVCNLPQDENRNIPAVTAGCAANPLMVNPDREVTLGNSSMYRSSSGRSVAGETNLRDIWLRFGGQIAGHVTKARPKAMQLREPRPIMKSFIWTLVLTAMVLGCAEASAGRSDSADPQGRMNVMSVADLERAGDQARATKDYDQAIAYFQAALRKDKKNPHLLNKLGLSQLKANQLVEARASFEKAVKRDSKYADGFNNLGAVYFVQRNLGAATRNFKKAVALNETKPVYHINLGAAWFGQNKLDRAMAEYNRALQLDPEALSQNSSAGISAQISTTEERARFDYMMAKLYAKMGNAEECLRCLKKAKEGGYRVNNVYQDEEFSRLWQDPRLAEITPPPAQ